jgi:uncharacterized protein
LTTPRLDFSMGSIRDFCCRWKVREFALFGSVLRDDFGLDSDVDVLVSFQDDAGWSLMDWGAMTDELAAIFGRKVDLVEKEGLRNPFRRRAILASAETLHAA